LNVIIIVDVIELHDINLYMCGYIQYKDNIHGHASRRTTMEASRKVDYMDMHVGGQWRQVGR